MRVEDDIFSDEHNLFIKVLKLSVLSKIIKEFLDLSNPARFFSGPHE
jgi:hypothetical protein